MKHFIAIITLCILLLSFTIQVNAHTLTTTHYSNNSNYINNFPQSDAIQTPWSFSSGRAHIDTKTIPFYVYTTAANNPIKNAMKDFIANEIVSYYNIDGMSLVYTSSSSNALITYKVNLDPEEPSDIFISVAATTDTQGDIQSVEVTIPYFYAHKVYTYEVLGQTAPLKEARCALCHATGLACGLGTYNSKNCNMNSSNFYNYYPQSGDRAGMRVMTGYHKHNQTKVYSDDYFYSVNDTNHRRYCSNCKLTQLQNHHYSAITYTKVDSSQHKITNRCDDCQHIYYVYEGHNYRSLANGSYSCISCGYTTTSPGGGVS